MSYRLRKMKIKAILLAATFLAAATIGVTFAWQTWNLDMTNVLKAHDTEVEIKEEFNQKSGDKRVWFYNKGSSSVFLRISYTEFWEIQGKWVEINQTVESSEENEESRDPAMETTAGNSENNQQYLPATVLSNVIEGQEVAIKYLADPQDKNEKIPNDEAVKRWKNQWSDGKKWFDGGDGWFYYKNILKAGESTSDILTKVLFDEILLNEHPEYKTAHYQLYFKAEVVQCSDGSNTLNSDEVNEDATRKLFGKVAKVGADGIVTWK